ncbi:MAG: ABC transporter ATP-binding protein [Desulfobacterales bacterium]
MPPRPESADPVIRLEDAVVAYREDMALQEVSLTVYRGEWLGILGPNGAGKTTLLTVVNGLGRLLRGRAFVFGREITRGCPASLRRRIGYVPQVQRIDPRMPISVREVVRLGACGRVGLFRRPRPADERLVDFWIDRVGIGPLSGRPIGHLSGGEQQRAAIARALVQQPEILLLDEPTTGLDRTSRVEILDLVRDVHRERAMTTLMVTHAHRRAAALCDRVVLMKEGRIWGEGPAAAMLQAETLNRLYDPEGEQG